MALFPIQTRSKQLARVSRLARFVGRQSTSDVHARLSSQVIDMSQHEARGYVRARASRVIYRQADLVLAGADVLAAKWQAELISQATNHVVEQVIHDLRSAQGAPLLLRKSA